LLNYLKKLFLIPGYYQKEGSYNPKAARDFKDNLTEFMREANKCMQIAFVKQYEPDNGCLKFSSFNTVHKKILENLYNRPEVNN